MDKKLIQQSLNGTTLIYAFRDGVTTFTVVPSNRIDDVKSDALYKDSWTQYFYVDPMVQIALQGDEVERDFSAGNTLYNSESAFALRFVDQRIVNLRHRKEIHTTLRNDKMEITHVVAQEDGYEAFEMYNIVKNISKNNFALDKFDSFFIGCLSPFMEHNDPTKIVFHELQSYWAMEARKLSQPVSNFNFDDSWSGLGIKHHRIGVNGTMTASQYHPFVGITDTENNVTWAVLMEAPCSWGIEATHKYGRISLSGGQADFINGHWRKTIKPGETFNTRKAYVAVVNGDLTKACSKLTRYQDNLFTYPIYEDEMPVIFNEYLTTWGHPTMANIPGQLPLIKKLECDYYVVDAGWFCDTGDQDELGDWYVAKSKFPNGLKEYTDYMYQNGFKKCGIWYEFENVTTNSRLAKEHPELLATRDGKIIQRKTRHFLDFNKPEVETYLDERVLKTIKENNITYVKLDYNENVGLGIDNPDSIGEGLRAHAEKVQQYIKKIRREVPDLVFEICSSGGMRHDISYLSCGCQCSFSDAHETAVGAVTAMDLHRIMQPRIMQIWASLLSKHSTDEIYQIVAKAMLGRVCFAGKLEELSPKVIDIALEGKKFYDTIKHIVRDGDTVLIDTDEIKNINNPHGSTRLVRMGKNKDEFVAYAFNFGDDVTSTSFNVPNEFKLVGQYGNAKIDETGNVMYKGAISAVVALYKKHD